VQVGQLWRGFANQSLLVERANYCGYISLLPDADSAVLFFSDLSVRHIRFLDYLYGIINHNRLIIFHQPVDCICLHVNQLDFGWLFKNAAVVEYDRVPSNQRPAEQTNYQPRRHSV